MKIEFLSKRSPHQILGIPSYAAVSQIRTAYLKRIDLLDDYPYDQSTHPLEWQVVNEIRLELINAYAELSSPFHYGTSRARTAAVSQQKPRPTQDENAVRAAVSMGNC